MEIPRLDIPRIKTPTKKQIVAFYTARNERGDGGEECGDGAKVAHGVEGGNVVWGEYFGEDCCVVIVGM
jgi:hypothetical protein